MSPWQGAQPAWSQRRRIFERLVASGRDVLGGRYFVVRGVVDWRPWNYELRPRGMAIFQSAASLLPSDGSDGTPTGMRWMRIAIELAASLELDPDGLPELDEEVADEMRQVVDEMIADLREESEGPHAGGGFRVVQTGSEVTEFSDVTNRVQGVVAQFQVEYEGR